MPYSKHKRARLEALSVANEKRKRLSLSDGNDKYDVEIQCEESELREQSTFSATNNSALNGRRLVSVFSLAKAMHNATRHTAFCKRGPISFTGGNKHGLSTSMTFACGCDEKFVVSTDDEQVSLNSNEALAWGCQVSAIGSGTSATKLLTSLDLPTPTFKTFQRRQDKLYEDLCKASNEEMAKWAKVELTLQLKMEFLRQLKASNILPYQSFWMGVGQNDRMDMAIVQTLE